jgi:hypothetical protein
LEKAAGVKIERETTMNKYGGIPIAFGPKVLMDFSFAVTLSEVRNKFKGTNSISKDSTLILKGIDSSVEDLQLDGYLVVQDG